MRHFNHLADTARDVLFGHQPQHIASDVTAVELGSWLGATLYLPAARPAVVDDLARQRARGVFAAVIDFEDSMTDSDALYARPRAARLLADLAASKHELPLVFLRLRNPSDIAGALGLADAVPQQLAGFAFPKFDPATNGAAWLGELSNASAIAGRRLVGMPILESTALAHIETRREFLLSIARMLARERDSIACIRVGVADIAGVFGLRRSPDTTIYDIKVVADVIGDVVNTFARPASGAIPVSGPVWEYFAKAERVLKPRLRVTPFLDHHATGIRESMMRSGLDALLSEIAMDRLNGLWGKTVIHPSHVGVVHAFSVVSHEEHQDAMSIIERESDGGVLASPAGNKMNEVRPHMAWARGILQRARVFGVLRPAVDFVDLLMEADELTVAQL
ncbi:ATP/GTP-binding protein [Salinibacterium xinjiangense]|nr:ATP/GTP-binding protein [Salinibacterium xinjiangense]